MKKLMVGLAPLLAVAAFMAVPAMASAEGPSWVVCTKVTVGTGKYKTSSCTTTGGTKSWEWEPVGRFPGIEPVSKNVPGIVATLSLPGSYGLLAECKTVVDESSIWNSGPEKIGTGDNYVTLSECRTSVELGDCTVTEPIVIEANTVLEEKAGKAFNKYTPAGPQPFGDIALTGTCFLSGAKIWLEGFFNGEVSGNKQIFNSRTGSELESGWGGVEIEFETEQNMVKGEAVSAS